jgi:dGTPase
MDRLRTFMFERVYLGEAAKREHPRIERMLRGLFEHYCEEPPPPMVSDATLEQRIVDWLAGMTDRFAVRAFSELAVPQGF